MLFLKLGKSGAYEVVDNFLGPVEFEKAPTTQGANGIDALESALAELTLSSNRDDVVKALYLIQGLSHVSAATMTILDRLGGCGDQEMAMDAIAAMTKFAPRHGLPILEKFLDTWKILHPGANVLSAVAATSDVAAESDLESLLGSSVTEIRSAAIYAIRRLKVPASTAALHRALDDSDLDVRYQAVISLAELNPKHNEYGPSIPAFERDPDRYTAHWKQWWLDEGQQKYNSIILR